MLLQHYLTLEEAEILLNDFHSGACDDHLYGMSTTKNIIQAGYFWPTLFRDCIHVFK
jgi:hypothetical protein